MSTGADSPLTPQPHPPRATWICSVASTDLHGSAQGPNWAPLGSWVPPTVASPLNRSRPGPDLGGVQGMFGLLLILCPLPASPSLQRLSCLRLTPCADVTLSAGPSRVSRLLKAPGD